MLFLSANAFGQPTAPLPSSSRFDALMDEGAALEGTDPLEAYFRYRDALRCADSLKRPADCAWASVALGRLQLLQGNMNLALQSLQEALGMYLEVGDWANVGLVKWRMANVYLHSTNYDAGLKEALEAKEIRQRIGKMDDVYAMYSIFGSLYFRKGDVDKALEYHNLALATAEAQTQPSLRAKSLGNIASVYSRQGQFSLGRSYHYQAIRFFREAGDEKGLIVEMNNLGANYGMAGELDSSIHYNTMAYQLADSLHFGDLVDGPAKTNWLAYSHKGEDAQALDWANKLIVHQDTFQKSNDLYQSKMADLSYKTQLEAQAKVFQTKTDLFEKDAEIQQQRVALLSIGLVGSLLAIFALIVFFRFRNKRRQNLILEEKISDRTEDLKSANVHLNAEIRKKEAAQEALQGFLYRSSHDLRGPITSLKGLLQLSHAEDVQAPYLDLITRKVDQLDGVLSQLIQKGEIEQRGQQKERLNCTEVWTQLQSDFQQRGCMTGGELTLKDDATGPVMGDAFLLQSVLKQLVFNAIDFQDLRKAEAHCRVSVYGKGEKWGLMAEDNGIGVPSAYQQEVFENFYRASNRSKGAGIGLFLVAEIGRAMGFAVKLESQEGTYTRVSFFHPDLPPPSFEEMAEQWEKEFPAAFLPESVH